MRKGVQGLSLVACFVLGTAIICSLAVAIWPHVHAVPVVQAQANTRTIIVDGPHRDDPIAIKEVLVDGEEAALAPPTAEDLKWWPGGGPATATGRPREWRVAYRIPSDDNWLRSLSFVLRNRTPENIDYVRIFVDLPQRGMGSGSDFFFGQLPAAVAYTDDGKPIPPIREPISFGPGQDMTFALADSQNADNLNNLIEHAGPLSVTTEVFVLFAVTLDDGMAWMEYSWFKPVPGHPGQSVAASSPWCFTNPNHLPGPACKRSALIPPRD